MKNQNCAVSVPLLIFGHTFPVSIVAAGVTTLPFKLSNDDAHMGHLKYYFCFVCEIGRNETQEECRSDERATRKQTRNAKQEFQACRQTDKSLLNASCGY